MAIVDISAPNFSPNLVPTITLKRWIKKAGDTVTSGETLCEISNGQKTGSLKANASGKLIQLLVDDGIILNPNQLLARLNTTEPENIASTQDTTPPHDLEKNQPPDDSNSIRLTHQITQLANKIEAIFSLTKTSASTAEETEKSRAADRLEILKTIQSAPATEAEKTNSSVQKILDRLDLLEVQLQTVTSKFSSAFEAMHATQVKTLEEVSKLCSILNTSPTLQPPPAATPPMTASQPQPPISTDTQQEAEMLSFLNWLKLRNTVTYADLRNRLLPHDLLPNAVIDEINEFALSLAGEPALEPDNDDVTVQSEVLMQVIGAWPGRE